MKVKIWYVRLRCVEMNIARAKARVDSGPTYPKVTFAKMEWKPCNLIKLLPYIDRLRLYDNSLEADPKRVRNHNLRYSFMWIQGRSLGLNWEALLSGLSQSSPERFDASHRRQTSKSRLPTDSTLIGLNRQHTNPLLA